MTVDPSGDGGALKDGSCRERVNVSIVALADR